MRIFDNPANLAQRTIQARLTDADPDATAENYEVDRLDETGQKTGTAYYTRINSILPGDQITDLLTPAATAAELAAIAEYNAIRQQVKTEYINMINRLDQIQAAANPTNAQVIQAIKDEAKYLTLIAQAIKRLLT
jgi:hypothetical protein